MPSKVFLITEVLEIILLATDLRTLLLSQRVCRRWRNLIQGSHYLRAALFLEPVRYRLPRGEKGVRNPLLEKYFWPWLRASRARKAWQPPLEGGQIIPQMDPEIDRCFLDYKHASWRRMLFQQPPRSIVGVIEMDSKIRGTPAYTEFQSRKTIRMEDIMSHRFSPQRDLIHPLPNEGIIWYGVLPPNGPLRYKSEAKEYFRRNGELKRGILSYARDIYLRDCDFVLFTDDARYARKDLYHNGGFSMELNRWLMDRLVATMVPGQTFIPVPVT